MAKTKTTHIVKLSDGREVLFSYGVAVAARVPLVHQCGCASSPEVEFIDDRETGRIIERPCNCSPDWGYASLDHTFSVTTSKHVNQFTERRAIRVSPSHFAELIAPLDANYPSGVM